MSAVVMAAIPRARMTAPPLVDNRRHHRRRRSHDWRGRRSRSRSGLRAGSQSQSRNKSGAAERPASRDKTHVSPPRVESDTLYQPDTQSRAVQDLPIIASSRLFSMGNLTSNRSMMTILIFGAAIRPDGQPMRPSGTGSRPLSPPPEPIRRPDSFPPAPLDGMDRPKPRSWPAC